MIIFKCVIHLAWMNYVVDITYLALMRDEPLFLAVKFGFMRFLCSRVDTENRGDKLHSTMTSIPIVAYVPFTSS